MSRSREQLIKFAFFSLIPLVVLILSGEVLCRIKFYFENDRDPGYLLAPFGEKAAGRQVADNIKINKYAKDTLLFSPCLGRLALRSLNEFHWRGGRPFTVAKPLGTYRILVVGGSTVFSIDNADEDTWVFILDKMLNSDSALAGKVEVINAGQSGFTSKNIGDLLKETGFKLQPDMVVYYEATNETLLVNLFWGDVDNKAAFCVYSLLNWFHRKLYYCSMFYTYLFEKIHFALRRNPRHWRFDENLTGMYFRRVIRSCKERSVDFVYVRQVIDYPLKKDGLDLTDENTLRKLLNKLYSTPLKETKQSELRKLYNDMQAYNQRLVNELQSRICREENVPVIDPLPVFDQERKKAVQLFTDICHKTCHGERILARCVYNDLRNIVREKILQKERSIFQSG